MIAWWALGLAVLAVFILFSVGLDLWTDALWFQSVGFDAVFWTQVGAQLGLFAAAGIGVLVILLGNLWLAGRLMPRSTGADGTGPARSGPVRAAERGRPAGRGPERRRRWTADEPRAVTFDADDIPDLTPVASIVLVVVSVLIALAIGGSIAAAWETVLLWRTGSLLAGHGVHRRPTRSSVATSRTSCSSCRSCGSCSRCSMASSSPRCSSCRGALPGRRDAQRVRVLTPVRVHLAVLGGLFLLSVAFGYQLDKYELAYSTRGIAAGVSFTDQNAQFFAYDVLTILSGLAAALLVGGAFTRMLWPLGPVGRRVGPGVDRRRAAVSGGHPAVHGPAQPVRPGRAVHRQQHRDDPPRLRAGRRGRTGRSAARTC